ncbi:hypothetical protein BDV26DRAFT_287769 [Aspergillus bertholletiae]|uniref:Beta/gamma crystallin 'Greek key' domain-containing protein n=1 Tax=Aspergillus bertholletiae TaxID=1226010 RepID=A0A5N7BNB5_9EURO|nr:hypothetical protein BDV26DRAFT_287769 [Aspergillus bertholletiae]
MMFNNLSITAIAMLSLLLPGAIAQPEAHSEPRSEQLASWDFKLKWHETTSCNDKGGNERQYSRGQCLGLHADTRAVEIIDRRESNCYLASYSDGNCQSDERILGNNGCWNLKKKWSVAFKC